MFADMLVLASRCGMAAILSGIAVVTTTAAFGQELVNENGAPKDPVMQYAEHMAPRKEFVLNSSADVELVRFKRSHDLSICVSRSTGRAPVGTGHDYPISVTWDSNVGIVTPGDCLAFDA